MVIMTVNHTHFFFASPALTPGTVGSTTVAQFLTWWVALICAPVFVLLAGTGTYLRGVRGATRGDTARFLLTRGLWLVLLEVTFVRWGWTFSTDYALSSGEILWVTGWSMIALAGLQYLPLWAVASVAVALIAGHNAFDGVRADDLGGWRPVWLLLHGKGRDAAPDATNLIDLGDGRQFLVLYPLVPWVGVMAGGYVLGRLFTMPEAARRRWLVVLGAAMVGLFVLIRWPNAYGDPRPWSVQPDDLFTLFSFVRCEKYPPSLLYLLMTLGPALLLLAVPASWWGAAGRVFVTYGRSPMLYYLLHIPLIHGLAMVFAQLRYGDASFLSAKEWLTTPKYPSDWGYDLWVVYAVWLAVVVGLYPVCLWFGRLKQRRKNWWWLSYL